MTQHQIDALMNLMALAYFISGFFFGIGFSVIFVIIIRMIEKRSKTP